jgi:hypothetical protein
LPQKLIYGAKACPNCKRRNLKSVGDKGTASFPQQSTVDSCNGSG